MEELFQCAVRDTTVVTFLSFHFTISLKQSDQQYLFQSQSRFRVIDLLWLSHCGMVGDVSLTPHDAQLKAQRKTPRCAQTGGKCPLALFTNQNSLNDIMGFL